MAKIATYQYDNGEMIFETTSTWAEHARDNADRGFPFHVWGARKDRALKGLDSVALLGSFATEQEAKEYQARESESLRPKGMWIVFVEQERF